METPTNDLVRRTFDFSLRCVNLVNALPPSRAADVIGKQLLRSATSVGANYLAARRARSRREFVARLGIIEEEADESLYWIELLIEAKIIPAERLEPLRCEASEIVAITVASIVTAREKLRRKPKPK